MINWNIFDKIYCIHYLPYRDRRNVIKKELSRIGIIDQKNFEFYYTVPNKYYDFLFWDDHIKSHLNLNMLNVNNLNYTINSYNLMNIIYRKKFKKVLIIEDDVFFLKNITEIKKLIDSCPIDNSNIINFEPFIWCPTKKFEDEYRDILNKDEKVNNDYIKLSNNRIVFDTGCIAFDLEFVEYYLDKQDDLFSPFDFYFKPTDDIKYCIPKTHLCIQRLYFVRQETTSDCLEKYPYVNKNLYARMEHL